MSTLYERSVNIINLNKFISDIWYPLFILFCLSLDGILNLLEIFFS